MQASSLHTVTSLECFALEGRRIIFQAEGSNRVRFRPVVQFAETAVNGDLEEIQCH